jgi:hypothetical protein
MENTYTMIAQDGAQYGPVSLEQLKSWIVEGRVAATTKILRSDTKSWLPASDYAELELRPAPPPSPGPFTATPAKATRPVPIQRTYDPQIRFGARWFFWIAGFSLFNTFAGKAGSHVVFLVGLGITQVIDGVTSNLGSAAVVAMALNLSIAAVFILLGIFASKGHGWSFIVGMVLYGLDGLIFLATSFWLGLAFHLYLLYRIFMGWKAIRDAQVGAL